MNKYCVIFPGQGSQKVGMGKELFDSLQSAREVFEEVDDTFQNLMSVYTNKKIYYYINNWYL